MRKALTCMLLCLCLSACTDNAAREMLDTAEFEERQMNQAHAKQLYEDLIRMYPSSKEAEVARSRLASLKAR